MQLEKNWCGQVMRNKQWPNIEGTKIFINARHLIIYIYIYKGRGRYSLKMYWERV